MTWAVTLSPTLYSPAGFPLPGTVSQVNVSVLPAGASILGVGYLLPLGYLIWSLKWGKIAPANPYGATGLEWQTSSPPPTANFEVQPTVSQEPYAYWRLEAQGD